MEYDSLLKKIGEFGKFQKQIYFAVCFISCSAAFNALGYVFWAARPAHWCHVDRPQGLENVSNELWKNWTIPIAKPETPSTGISYDSCLRYNISGATLGDETGAITYHGWTNESSQVIQTVPCDSWDYDTKVYMSSIVSKYTLVCDRKWLISITQSIYMAGRVVGTLGMGALADKFGRRPVILICILLQVISGVTIAFAPNVATFIALRCLLAVFATGSWQSIYVYVMEIVGPSWRVFTGTVIMWYWAVAYMLLGLISYFIRDHFILMLVTSVPFVLMLVFYWIITESPRWLLVNNRKKEAFSIITKMAKVNGKMLKSKTDYDIIIDSKDKVWGSLSETEKQKSNAKSNLCDTCKSPYIWRMTAVLLFIWFTNSVVYYGLSLNTSDLGGSDHLNFFIAGAVELPAYIICYLTFNRFGRQWPLTLMTLMAGLSLLATAAVPSGQFIATVILATLGKFAITCTYSMIYIYTTELFPTSVRTITLGICGCAARVGGILTPYAADLSVLYPGAPLLLFGLFATIASVLVLTLPETQGLPLPQTLEDGRLLAQKPNIFSRCIQKRKAIVLVSDEEEPMTETKP